MLRHMILALAVVSGVGLSAPAARADNLSGQPIYVQNNANRTIWVAARYCPPGSSSYVNDGYWRVDPGQRTLILYNNAVWIYLHAHDAQGVVTGGNGSPVRQTIRGKTVDLYPVNTGADFNSRVWTVSSFN